MQYKVPQNIDKPDQIVGPLTLVQFSYLAIGGALDILLNQTFTSALKYPFIFIISAVALGFAFLKIQDRPLQFFISASISYLFQPKTRIWHKMNDRPIFQLNKAAPKQEKKAPSKTYNPKDIENISQVLDAHGKVAEKPVFENMK